MFDKVTYIRDRVYRRDFIIQFQRVINEERRVGFMGTIGVS